MNPLRTAFVLLVAFVLLGLPGVGTAVPIVDLSWNACSPVVTTATRESPNPISLYTSVTGMDQLHQAYETRVHIRPITLFLQLPDAWRFDAPGCQGLGLITMRHVPPLFMAKACPPMQGSVPSIQIKDYSYDPLSSVARCVVSNSYPGGVTSVDPSARYFLMSVEFDHTYSVVGNGTPGLTCGQFEIDLVLSFDVPGCLNCGPGNPQWLDLQGAQHSFVVGNGRLEFCGSCAPTPAAPTTWGAIKGQYRR